MRKAIIFALAFLLLLPLARADTYLTDCAVLDTPGETYYLTQDIIDSSATTCMDITADNVTLDCQGHTIDGVDTGGTYGIATARPNATIKNCILTDWYYGIGLGSSNNTLSNIIVNSIPVIAIYIECCFLNYNNISNIIANYNLLGIYIDHSSFNTLSNITANSNTYYGIYLFENSNYNNLTDITANSNGDGIYIWASSSNIIKNSIIQNNSQYGIVIDYAGSTPNLIYNNLFNNTNNLDFEGTIWANNWNTTRQTGTRIYSAGTEIGGNYWTNPDGTGYSDTCTDDDKDGFCDDPYVLANDNVDYLALSDEYTPPTTTTLPPVHGVPLLSSTLVGVVIGVGIITFMLRTLFDIREPKKVIEYFIVLVVIVLTVISIIALFA